MRYYSEDTVKGILEQIDSHYVKELEGLPSVDILDSPWHTGEPIEEGWYLVECQIGNFKFYATDHWNNEVGYWTVNRVIRWQKIEE